MSMITEKFEDERVNINVIMLASDENVIRLRVRTIGDRVRLRDACRRVYTRSSTSVSLGDTHRTSSNRPGREKRGQSRCNNYSNSNINRKRKADYTWTGRFMCLSNCHAKKNTNTNGKTSVIGGNLGS